MRAGRTRPGWISSHLADPVTGGLRSGQLLPRGRSFVRLFRGESATRHAEIAVEPTATISGLPVLSEREMASAPVR